MNKCKRSDAAFAGCRDITAVDSSEHSISQAKKNAELNGFPGIEFMKDDVNDYFDKIFQSLGSLKAAAVP